MPTRAQTPAQTRALARPLNLRLLPPFPDEISIRVVPHLDFFSLVTLLRVSKDWKSFIDNDGEACGKLFRHVKSDDNPAKNMAAVDAAWTTLYKSLGPDDEILDFVEFHPFLKAERKRGITIEREKLISGGYARLSANVKKGRLRPRDGLWKTMFATFPPVTTIWYECIKGHRCVHSRYKVVVYNDEGIKLHDLSSQFVQTPAVQSFVLLEINLLPRLDLPEETANDNRFYPRRLSWRP